MGGRPNTVRVCLALSKSLAFHETLRVEHHQKSRLGNGETFDIMAGPKPGRLAPIKHVPRVIQESKQTPAIDPDLHAKISAKLERASRKRQVKRTQIDQQTHCFSPLSLKELEDARRLASSRVGHRPPTRARRSSPAHSTMSGPDEGMSKRDERHQQLSMLRDQLRHNETQSPMHTPRTPRGESVASGMTDMARGTARRAGHVVGATTASNFKPVYD